MPPIARGLLSGGDSKSPTAGAGGVSIAASPVTNADGKKVVRLEFRADITGFDPAAAPDLYSAIVIDGVFDTLLTYDYLAEPSKLVPKITEGMPEVSEGGAGTLRRSEPRPERPGAKRQEWEC